MQRLNSIFRLALLVAGSLFAYEPCGHLFPSSPCTHCPCDPHEMFWTTDLSVLAWQAREEGLEIGLQNNHLVGIEFNWEPAFKITVGADFPVRGWDVQMKWTHFDSHTSNRFSDNLIPIWVPPLIASSNQSSAKGTWKLDLNGYDIEMGYHAFLSPAMALRFHCDIKVVTIDQDFHVGYSNLNNVVLSNRSIGAGPRLGFDSKWFLGNGFSLLANLSGSLPLWHYRIYRTDDDPGIHSHFRQRFWTFRAILETSLGFGWDTCFGCRCQFPFGVAAQYEFQYFPEQNMMAQLVNPGVLNLAFEPRGDLHLHGATVTFHFGF